MKRGRPWTGPVFVPNLRRVLGYFVAHEMAASRDPMGNFVVKCPGVSTAEEWRR